MFFDPLYLVLVVVMLAISGFAAWRVRSTYARWSKVDSGIDLSAYDFARRLLDRQDLTNVQIEPTPGALTDHYDPRSKTLRVSQTVASTGTGGGPQLSVAAAAVIAHEVGHALQDRQRDPWLTARSVIVPVASFGSSIAPWLIIAGILLQLTGLAIVGLIGFAAAFAFTLITLPVEIGASGKALAFVEGLGMVGERQDGARAVLKAAAWTYVAAALTALLQFLYYFSLVMGRRD
ncbi:MAG TPA: zinc metallopeptidase [Candidatus Limnocylindria bacterium]|nr:zinc metallopeptidase [Candidatus Limnocylindria bacterium]